MNVVTILGRLTKDPELRYTQAGKATCRFTLAVDRGLSREKKEQAQANGQPTADFIPCQAWGKTAELIVNYLKKGRQAAVEGSIRTGSYENQEGKRIYTTDVNVYKLHFINDGQGNQASQGQSQENTGQDSFYPIDDEDIPF